MKENEVDFEKYQEYYSEDGFWEKVKNFALKAGAKVIYTALKLYYATKRKETPVWAKNTIYGALGYFILPIDLIPDGIPVVGFTDDMGLLIAALAVVAHHVTPEDEAKAKEQLSKWFGSDALLMIES